MRLAITGGASGIGAKTISLLQSAGHELVVFDRHEPTADVTYVPLDLMNGDDIETAVAKADGTFDGLAFIAGIPPRDDNAAACLTVNAISTVRFISGFMDKLNDGAAVVTVASRAGLGWQDNTAMLNDILSRGQDEMQAFCDAGKIDAAIQRIAPQDLARARGGQGILVVDRGMADLDDDVAVGEVIDGQVLEPGDDLAVLFVDSVCAEIVRCAHWFRSSQESQASRPCELRTTSQ